MRIMAILLSFALLAGCISRPAIAESDTEALPATVTDLADPFRQEETLENSVRFLITAGPGVMEKNARLTIAEERNEKFGRGSD